RCVFYGITDPPAGLSSGDWIQIPRGPNWGDVGRRGRGPAEGTAGLGVGVRRYQQYPGRGVSRIQTAYPSCPRGGRTAPLQPEDAGRVESGADRPRLCAVVLSYRSGRPSPGGGGDYRRGTPGGGCNDGCRYV